MSPAFRYGLLAGLASCLWLYAEFALGFHTTRAGIGAFTGYLPDVILLTSLTLLLRQLHAAGRLTPGVALRNGLYASLVASLLSYCFLLLYNQVIDPVWIDTALDLKVAQLRAQHLTELDVRAEIVAFRRLHSPLGLAPGTLLAPILAGGFYSLVITLLRRRTPAATGR